MGKVIQSKCKSVLGIERNVELSLKGFQESS